MTMEDPWDDAANRRTGEAQNGRFGIVNNNHGEGRTTL